MDFNVLYTSYIARTNPADVARVESKTVICTKNRRETVPIPKDGVVGTVGHWADPDEMKVKLQNLFNGCMKGMVAYWLSCIGFHQVFIMHVSIVVNYEQTSTV